MSAPASSEERESLLSAMFDGELSGGECELLARRLARDVALRRKWARHALVGAVVRGDREVLVRSGFAERVSAAIAREADLGEPATTAGVGAARPRARAGGLRWRRPLAAVAVAASVAVVSILLLRSQPLAPPGGALVAVSPPRSAETPAAAARSAGSEPESYVVPAPTRDRASAVPAAQLANYVVAHSEFSSPLGRRNLLSALMAGESVPLGAQAAGAAPAAGGPDGSALNDAAAAGDALR